MTLLLLAIGVLAGSGVAALAAARTRLGSPLGVVGAVAGCAIGLVPTVGVLAGGPTGSLRLPWDVPYGAFFVELDLLSAFFLVPILGLSALAAIYGDEYLASMRAGRSTGSSWCFFNGLIASMVLVVVARNAVLFLMAWEIMALASFFLVTFEDDQASVREAGWTYLVASQLGTASLLALFILLRGASESLDFDALQAGAVSHGLLFVLAVVGFGTKAGFMPLHVWLPEAHPAAPSHVSALMSGVMIKTGIYGLMRMLIILGPPPLWWGWLLCAIGLTSGIFGVLFALAQHDLKRLLAYSSVENVGIVTIGLGIGELGRTLGSAPLAVLGFAGALLHVLNHAVFKGLLFLAAGAVGHATGTRDLDRLGGLLKRMPWTGAVFCVGAVAIAGLPPLNGFASEFLILLAALSGIVAGDAKTAAGLIGVVGGLALIAALAAACFTKAFGLTFLGEPRAEAAARAHDPGLAMRLPMLLLAAACVVITPLVIAALPPVVELVSGGSATAVGAAMTSATSVLWSVALMGGGLSLLIALLSGLRRRLLAGRRVEERCTWDCGYARPSARMQYGAASFSQPLTDLFAPALQSHHHLMTPTGLFPLVAVSDSETPDVCMARFYSPLFSAIGRGMAALRWLQQGRVHLYVLYIALTLLVLLVWKLG